MCDVLERPVLATLGGHRHEQSGIAVDHFQIAHDEACVESDGDVGLQPLLVHREDANLGDFHCRTPLAEVLRPSEGRYFPG